MFKYIHLMVIFIFTINITYAQDSISHTRKDGVENIYIGSKNKCYWIKEETISKDYTPPQFTNISGFNNDRNTGTVSIGNKSNPVWKIIHKSKIVNLQLDCPGATNDPIQYYFYNQTSNRITSHLTGTIGKIEIQGTFKQLEVQPDFQNDLMLYTASLRADTLKVITPKYVQLLNDDLKYFVLSNWAGSSKLGIFSSKIDSFKIIGNIPDTTILSDLDLSGVKKPIDLSNYNTSKKICLFVKNIDLNKLKIHLGYTKVYLLNQPYESKLAGYQQLVKLSNDGGYTEEAEFYDKQLQELKYTYNGHPIINYISWIWWDYGYDKARVIYISLILFIFFSILNVTLSHQVKKVYWPHKFSKFEDRLNEQYLEEFGNLQIKKRIKHSFGIVLYTAFVFWGVKLDLKDLEIRNGWIILLIITQYILGIICLAYLANFIITK